MINNNFGKLSGPRGFLSNNEQSKRFFKDLPEQLKEMGINAGGNSKKTAEKLQEELFEGMAGKGVTSSQFKKNIEQSKTLSYPEKKKMLDWFLKEPEIEPEVGDENN